MRLENKVAVITGAGSGIGQATSELFAREGAKVIVADINDKGGSETVKKIHKAGGDAFYVHTDVSKAADVENLIDASVKKYNKIDILFNNAGHPGENIPVEDIDESLFDLVYGVNVKGIFFGAKYAVPVMKRQGHGVILNTASVAGDRPRPGILVYSSSKGAAIVMTKALAIELAPFNIRVNCINPVATDTPMNDKFRHKSMSKADFRKSIVATVPMGRYAEAVDIANAALYLCSDEASIVTGAVLHVDGGRNI
jgi:3-oxoacyl-[acyl-carrier protein] reductase